MNEALIDSLMQLAEDYADEALNYGLYAPATYEARDRLRKAISAGLPRPQEVAGVADDRLKELWLACKSIDNREFCIEFGRAVIGEMRVSQSPELSCWFRNCSSVEACAESGCKSLAAPVAISFEEWQAKHGPNGAAYDIEMQRAGWDGAIFSMRHSSGSAGLEIARLASMPAKESKIPTKP